MLALANPLSLAYRVMLANAARWGKKVDVNSSQYVNMLVMNLEATCNGLVITKANASESFMSPQSQNLNTHSMKLHSNVC